MSMEFSHDELRRQPGDLDAEPGASVPAWRDALARVFSADTTASGSAATVDRRRFFRIGSFALASSAVVAACARHGAAKSVPVLGDVEAAPTTVARVVDDVTLLRTASSLEAAAVSVYDLALGGILTDATVIDTAKVIRAQHAEHQALFERTTRAAGGSPYADPNPAVMANVVQPAKADLKDDASMIAFAVSIEDIVAATYQALVPLLTKADLRQTSMSVGGVAARHGAILRGLLDGTVPVAGFGAVKHAGEPTTTVAAGGTAAVEIAQVPGAFAKVAAALGPNSYAY